MKEFFLLIFCFGFFGYLYPKDMEIGNPKKQDVKVSFTQANSMIDSFTTASFSETFYDIVAKNNHVNIQNLTMTFCLGKGQAIKIYFKALSLKCVWDCRNVSDFFVFQRILLILAKYRTSFF
jgi:hypothetical protein